jgi:hypothetical protein
VALGVASAPLLDLIFDGDLLFFLTFDLDLLLDFVPFRTHFFLDLLLLLFGFDRLSFPLERERFRYLDNTVLMPLIASCL